MSRRTPSFCLCNSLLVLLSTTSVAAAPQVPKITTSWQTTTATQATVMGVGGCQLMPAGTDLMTGTNSLSVSNSNSSLFASVRFDHVISGRGDSLRITHDVNGAGGGIPVPTAIVGGGTRSCVVVGAHSTLITLKSTGVDIMTVLVLTARGSASVTAGPLGSPTAKLEFQVDVGDDGSVDWTYTAPTTPVQLTKKLPILVTSAGLKIRTWSTAKGNTALVGGTFKASGWVNLHTEAIEFDRYEFNGVHRVSDAGDVDGDGYDDIATTGTGFSRNRVSVYSGRTGQRLWITSYFFTEPRIAAAGDVNADGFDDLIVGSPQSSVFAPSSIVAVYSGKSGTPLYWYVESIKGYGEAVSGAGDVNADGFDDFVVGAGSGDLAIVYSGRAGTKLYQYAGDRLSDRFGAAVAGAGDVNDDSYADVVVGAPGDDNKGIDSGSARVFSGRTGAALYTVNGESAGDLFGTALDGGDDFNFDQKPDIAIGAPGDDNNGTDSGSVRVISGSNGALLSSYDGDASHDWFGWSVAMVGDTNANHAPEVCVGAPQSAGPTPGPGYVRVFDYFNTRVRATVYGRSNGDEFGDTIGGRADTASDGCSELLVAAPGDTSAASPGSARVLNLYYYNSPSKFIDYGAGCPGSDGRMPRIGIGRAASIGQYLDITLASAPYSKPGLLRLAIGRTSLNLNFIGMTGCTLLTDLAIFAIGLPMVVDPTGRSSMTFLLPNQWSMIGGQLTFQWTILDANANPLGIIVSDGGEITVGR